MTSDPKKGIVGVDGCQLHRLIKMRRLLLQTDQLISLHQTISQSPSPRRTNLHTYTNVHAHAAGCLKHFRWICQDYLLDPVLSRGRVKARMFLCSRSGHLFLSYVCYRNNHREMNKRNTSIFNVAFSDVRCYWFQEVLNNI